MFYLNDLSDLNFTEILILGFQKNHVWPQYHKESSWQICQSRLCPKEKEQSHLSRSPDCEVRQESR